MQIFSVASASDSGVNDGDVPMPPCLLIRHIVVMSRKAHYHAHFNPKP